MYRLARTVLRACAMTVPALQLSAQRVALEVKPRPGDTLHITLDQSVTLTGGPRNWPDSSTTVTWAYYIKTRNVAEKQQDNGTIVRAIVDTVRMRTTGSIGASPFPGVDRSMEGMKVRLRVQTDGAAQLVEGMSQIDLELRQLLGETPAVLPTAPVAVGESWSKQLLMPAVGAPSGAAPMATAMATFRFDSLTANGDLAWISVRARVEPAPLPKGAKSEGIAQRAGTATGLLKLDRRRGWLASSEATVVFDYTVTVPGGGSPLDVRVQVSHVMRTAASRR